MDLSLAKLSNSRLWGFARFGALLFFLIAGCLLAASLVDAGSLKRTDKVSMRTAASVVPTTLAPRG